METTGPIPLSSAQLGIWYRQHMDPLVPINIAQYVELRGDLDFATLARASHAAALEIGSGFLRILETDAGPVQVVDPSVGGGLEPVDLRAAADPVAAAHDWMSADYRSPIDIVDDRLLRAALLRLGRDHWFWYARAHHIALDGYGAMTFMTRAAELYTAALDGRGSTARTVNSPLVIHDSEQAYRAGTRFGADRDYWAEQVAGLDQRSSLSARFASPSATNQVVGENAPPGFDALLTRAQARFDASAAELLIAAFTVYLATWSGTDQVTLSLPVAARTTAALRRCGGVTSNIVPLRLALEPDSTTGDLTKRVRAAISGALRHQRFWHEDIRRETAAPEAEYGAEFFGPWVNIMMFHDQVSLGAVPGTFHVLSTGSIEDLAVNFYRPEGGGRTRIDFETNPELYSPAEASGHQRRFVAFFERFLAADTDTPIRGLALASPAEYQRTVVEWNDTAHTVPDVTLVDLLDRQAHRVPDRVALECAEVTLTYAEFSAAVHRLGRLLIERGVGPESVVVLCLRRSVELVVAMHAVLAAGGAYAPIDPDQPAERTAHILESAAAACLLRTSDIDPPGGGLPEIVVDDVELTGYSGAPIVDRERRTPLRPEHPAYVIYTSGSTGRPKGVAVAHLAIVNQQLWMLDRYSITPADVYLQKTAVTFDVSLWGYFLPLMAGARLILAAPDGHLDPAYIAEMIARHSVTLTDFAPSTLAMFTRYAGGGQCDSLRDVFVIGEALPPATAAEFQRISHAGLHNLYGPTEAAVSVTHHRVDGHGAAVPIGVPEWNVAVYVLDARLRPVPVGAAGELYLAGRQLARGYRGKPALSAERFVADPFTTTGRRMYRTGDLARWSDRGVLEYLGRTDFQVKFRGQRLELGEIEAHLLTHPAVGQAAVIADDDPARPGLVAYVSPAPGQTVDTAALRSALATVLPEALVPGVIVALDALPLNASGKLDRAALPTPTPARTHRRAGSATERLVARVFAELLEVTDIDTDLDFFTLGGNSLLAYRLRGVLMEETGRQLPLREFFRSPTVAGLADLIDNGSGTADPLRLESDSRIRLVPADPRADTADSHLLTGATGFLGAHLLRELLANPDSQVWCPVRADSNEQAAQRITETLRRYRLWEPGLRDRIVPLPADLSRPGLGLETDTYRLLAEQTGSIFHAAAQVNHLDGYERLRAVNVGGVRELLRLATRGAGKSVHYISTTSMFTGHWYAPDVPIHERQIAEQAHVEHSGYLTSKWVAEQLIRSAARQGVPASIYRTSLLGGDSRTGVSTAEPTVWDTIRAIVSLGLAPDVVDWSVEIAPVDHIARAITGIATTAEAIGNTFHVVEHDHVRVAGILGMLRRRGHSIQEVPLTEFRNRLRATAADRMAAGDYSLTGAALLADSTDWRSQQAMRFDDSNTRKALAAAGIDPPRIDAGILGHYLDYFQDSGFLPLPAATRPARVG